jgi:hypothetical protein
MAEVDLSAIVKYFALNEHPFIPGPDPRYLYFSSQVKEALAKCEIAQPPHGSGCCGIPADAYYLLGRYQDALASLKTHFEERFITESAALLMRMADDVLGEKLQGVPPRSEGVRAVRRAILVVADSTRRLV